MPHRKMPRLAAALMLLAAPPALAQGVNFSQTYNFLKAVKDRDFNKTVEAMNAGPTVINGREDSTGETALHIVTRGRDLPWMNFLLQNGIDPNARDKAGGTPLMTAADQRFLDGAKVLIARGAKVNVANRNGETPLIRAVQLKDSQMVRLLMDNGADPDAQDSLAGYSARDYAERDGRGSQIAQILRAAKKPGAAPGQAAAATPAS